jgi:hypothetical protein
MHSMSLLDAGPHQVLVYPEVQTLDSRGNPVKRPADVGVVITGCTVTPVVGGRDRDAEHVRADYQLLARDAPIGPWSRIEFADGRTFAVIDGPHRFTASEATRHVSVILGWLDHNFLRDG